MATAPSKFEFVEINIVNANAYLGEIRDNKQQRPYVVLGVFARLSNGIQTIFTGRESSRHPLALPSCPIDDFSTITGAARLLLTDTLKYPVRETAIMEYDTAAWEMRQMKGTVVKNSIRERNRLLFAASCTVDIKLLNPSERTLYREGNFATPLNAMKRIVSHNKATATAGGNELWTPPMLQIINALTRQIPTNTTGDLDPVPPQILD